MKKFVATLLLIGTAFTASACSTSSQMGYVDKAPYADERTAGSEPGKVADEVLGNEPMKYKPSAEKVFVKKQSK